LRRILLAYARYYNDIRTHRSLDKDAPALRTIQRIGDIASYPILGGLHHHFVRGLSFQYTHTGLNRAQCESPLSASSARRPCYYGPYTCDRLRSAGTPTVKGNPVNDRECAGLLDVDEARRNTDGRHERG
jgi:hypothetical protein